MKKRTLFWVLLPSYWILTVVAIAAVSLYAFRSMSNIYLQSLETDLVTRARMLGEHAITLWRPGVSCRAGLPDQRGREVKAPVRSGPRAPDESPPRAFPAGSAIEDRLRARERFTRLIRHRPTDVVTRQLG